LRGVEPRVWFGCLRGVSELTGAAGVSSAAGVGRAGSFEDFYRGEFAGSLRLAWLLTGSRPAAEDVVQDAMTGVYRFFDGIEQPGAYLRRAVVNRARSEVRDERRQRERVSFLERKASVLSSADSKLLDLVRDLPYRQRVVIVGRYWGGWSEADIAAVLGCRPGTVKSLASRALARLREEVEQ
jgi:RNA polymerase sigma factor (sigma-70 family)